MVSIRMYSKRTKYSRREKVDYYELDRFPNWSDMIEVCTKFNVRATDFISKPQNKERTEWVGKVLNASAEGNRSGGERICTVFYIYCDTAPSYEEIAR